MLSARQRECWERDGFFLEAAFEPEATCKAMLARVEQIARDSGGEGRLGPVIVQPESKLRSTGLRPEQRISKIFRIHRQEPVFNACCRDERLLDWLTELIAPDIDCFLSQFIFKQPRALGQPWHQDAYYFPFDKTPQIGVWLAVTEATLYNSPLFVLPGSHREPIHAVVRDRRPHANRGYVEIVDHDMSGAVPVLMRPGDLLVFHGHLMHMSTDNQTDTLRASMVYHYGEAGTVDYSEQKFGFNPDNQDWLSVRRQET